MKNVEFIFKKTFSQSQVRIGMKNVQILFKGLDPTRSCKKNQTRPDQLPCRHTCCKHEDSLTLSSNLLEMLLPLRWKAPPPPPPSSAASLRLFELSCLPKKPIMEGGGSLGSAALTRPEQTRREFTCSKI